MDWYLKVVKNYVGFYGRASRKEYWMFILFNFIFALILSIVENAIGLPYVLTTIYYLALLLPSLAVSIRRLHDTGRSGWWVLISLIPLIGSIILIVFFCLESQETKNQHGPNPLHSLG
jgi:uncharacterized membrane protein YhaH (DUF805 family)